MLKLNSNDIDYIKNNLMERSYILKNIKITESITQGMYVLTTEGGGCIVDAVSQISSGENPLISVAIMKKNYTNTLLKENNKFAISILSKEVNSEIIKTFGFNSSREIDKYKNVDISRIENINIIKDSIGYMICEVVDLIENDTHTLFIGKVVEADVQSSKEPMSYQYYQQHKEEILKITTQKGKTAWICSICGYICYYDEIPVDYKCPICGVNREHFKLKQTV